jgi:hypothetical protein
VSDFKHRGIFGKDGSGEAHEEIDPFESQSVKATSDPQSTDPD